MAAPNSGNGASPVGELAAAFAALKQAYERHWSGLERLEPEPLRTALRERLRAARQAAAQHPNTAEQYRLQTLFQSFASYDALCERRGDQRQRRGGTPRKGAPPPAASPTAPGRLLGAEDAKQAFVPPATAPTAGTSAHHALYKQLLSTLAAQGRPPIAEAAFAAQVDRHLAAARASANTTRLVTDLEVSADGRIKLVVRPVP